MALSVAYKSQALLTVIPDERPVKQKLATPKSIYTIARELKFKRAALKKYEPRIKEIQKYFPGWEPVL